jgi:hypothetical protein
MTEKINQRRRRLMLLFGASMAIPLTPTMLQAADKKGENMFAMTEEGRLYWLEGGMGYCGEALQPDIAEISAAAEAGNNIAAFRLGQLYESGRWGVEKNMSKAVKWYHMAAERGLVDAMTKLAFSYEFGKGVDKNLKEALTWYKKAHEQRLEDDYLLEKIDELESRLAE